MELKQEFRLPVYSVVRALSGLAAKNASWPGLKGATTRCLHFSHLIQSKSPRLRYP